MVLTPIKARGTNYQIRPGLEATGSTCSPYKAYGLVLADNALYQFCHSLLKVYKLEYKIEDSKL